MKGPAYLLVLPLRAAQRKTSSRITAMMQKPAIRPIHADMFNALVKSELIGGDVWPVGPGV